jgi:hypothetical protein
MQKIKINRKILILFAVFVVLILGIYFLAGNKYLLSISTYPQGSTISVNNKYKSESTFSKKLSKGTYEIIVSKEGYVSQTIKVELTKDENVVFSLKPANAVDQVEVSRFKNVGAYSIGDATKGEQDFLVAIDKRNGHLIKIDQGTISTIYAKPVYSFSFSYPLVALIEEADKSKIITIDLTNNKVSTLDASGSAPIVSVSLSKDVKSVYFLGNYDLRTRYSKLYKASLSKFVPEEIFTTQANIVNYLSESFILLLEEADGLDLSKAFILSLEDYKVKHTAMCNYYKVSSSREKIAFVSSQNITLFEINSLKTTSKSFSNIESADWKNDITLLVVDKTNVEQKIYYLDTNALSLTEPFTQTAVNNMDILFIVALDNKTLHYINSSGTLNKVDLP